MQTKIIHVFLRIVRIKPSCGQMTLLDDETTLPGDSPVVYRRAHVLSHVRQLRPLCLLTQCTSAILDVDAGKLGIVITTINVIPAINVIRINHKISPVCNTRNKCNKCFLKVFNHNHKCYSNKRPRNGSQLTVNGMHCAYVWLLLVCKQTTFRLLFCFNLVLPYGLHVCQVIAK